MNQSWTGGQYRSEKLQQPGRSQVGLEKHGRLEPAKLAGRT
jgi:hypothetical protein